jgi:hypothetical protein
MRIFAPVLMALCVHDTLNSLGQIAADLILHHLR